MALFKSRKCMFCYLNVSSMNIPRRQVIFALITKRFLVLRYCIFLFALVSIYTLSKFPSEFWQQMKNSLITPLMFSKHFKRQKGHDATKRPSIQSAKIFSYFFFGNTGPQNIIFTLNYETPNFS